jgi:hydroxymethylpyrimidine/phosphomethylpyrimidine kinase
VNDLYVIPTELVEKQLNHVINDLPPKCIKTGRNNFFVEANIGILANEDIISVVAKILAKNSIPSVVDLVFPTSLTSKPAASFLPQSVAVAYLKELFPLSTISTLSLPEALVISKIAGRDFGDVAGLTIDKRLELATFLASMGPWILLKGGRAPVEQGGTKVAIDILANNEGQTHEFISELSPLNTAPGTGCTLACIVSYLSRLMEASIASNLALGYDTMEASQKAIDFVQGAIQHSSPTNGLINCLYRQRILPFTPCVPPSPPPPQKKNKNNFLTIGANSMTTSSTTHE